MARWCALAGLVGSVALAAPASAHGTDRLPVCKTGGASTKPPAGRASDSSPAACKATVNPTLGRAGAASTPAGYHHLGAGTTNAWAGVTGRLAVVDSAVRRNTYDFVASRFMVKRDTGGGRIAWLEAGWAETGWAGKGRQLIYTFNTNTNQWQFYEQYQLKPGDRIWLDLHTDGNNVWQAWLWWNNRWNLLTSQRLPIGASAYVEQYVEVHVDAGKAARITLPSVTVDNVQLRPPGGGRSRYWREDVATQQAGNTSPQRTGGFCLKWVTHFDTWTAGDCPKPR